MKPYWLIKKKGFDSYLPRIYANQSLNWYLTLIVPDINAPAIGDGDDPNRAEIQTHNQFGSPKVPKNISV